MKPKFNITDLPAIFSLREMEKEALYPGSFYDQARRVLQEAKEEAGRCGISLGRLRFYIDCFGSGYQYYLADKDWEDFEMKSPQVVRIMKQIHALRVYHASCMKESLRVFPELQEFLQDNKDRDFSDVIKELDDQLQKLGEENE